jgi:hypothetical protein
MFGWKTFTDNGKYWVSTSNLKDVGIPTLENILNYTYETMVFPLADGEIQYGENVECLRTNDEDAAYLNHLKMFEKYNNL